MALQANRLLTMTTSSNFPKESHTPVLIVVMGVSGSGKTTLGKALAGHLNWRFLDADDFHSAESRAHMASGKPLTDDMRKPWISAICQELKEHAEDNRPAILAFSGLKKFHREPLRHCGLNVIFLHLTGERETLAQRMLARNDHFMPPSLLDSQLETLEIPADEEDVFSLAIETPLEDLLIQAEKLVNQHGNS